MTTIQHNASMPNVADNAKVSSDIEHVDWSTGTGGSSHNYANVRFGSGSSQASQNSGDICRICHCESDPQNPLLTPCYCSGSLKYVHQACLQQWLTASETNACELCKFPFIMHTKIKPFNEWRSLDISGIERRRLCCSMLFHCAAALCVIWSLCVLIERAADDVQRGLIDWPFWTKLAVVTVGMTGGIVFMYIQCKAYLHLCHRWKARNRILLIQNAPEKVHPLSPPSPVAQHRSRRAGSASEPRISDRERIGISSSAAVEIADNAVNSGTMNAYGYVSTSNGNDPAGSDIDETRSAGGSLHHHHHGHNALRHHHHHHHHQHSHMPSSPNHMLPNADTDADSLATHASSSSALGMYPNMLHNVHHQLLAGGGAAGQQHPLGQVAVAANIECSQSQHNYERDWALDDVVSQISSFRPCPQGSGSMTPFHDSIHNVLENSEECSSRDSRQNLSTGGVSSEMGREHALQLSSFSGSGEHKAPSIGSSGSSAVANGLGGFVYKPHNKRYSNSSIFLENRDILNDTEAAGDYQKINYRHSSIIPSSPDEAGSSGGVGRSGNGSGDADQLEKFLGKDLRRYSDTKLVAMAPNGSKDAEAHDPMLCSVVAADSALRDNTHKLPSRAVAPAHTVLDMVLPVSPLSPPAAYGGQHRQAALLNMHRSMHTVEMGEEIAKQTGNSPDTCAAPQMDNTRALFKSLPNLSSSSESLIKK